LLEDEDVPDQFYGFLMDFRVKFFKNTSPILNTLLISGLDEKFLWVAMSFSTIEKAAMFKIKGVGETVITRLEELGYSSLAELKSAEPQDITREIAQRMGSTCWQNSPQARKAIQDVINLAQRY
jgi:hypothetical protein